MSAEQYAEEVLYRDLDDSTEAGSPVGERHISDVILDLKGNDCGFELFNQRPDKGYSLTDCVSMQTIRREGLTDVLTNDRHFEQEGFRALFRPV